MNLPKTDKYDPTYVKALFDSMSRTYSFTNYVSSFGFSERWRRQCIQDLPPIPTDAKGYDLMSGMGESWRYLAARLSQHGKIVAVDISDEMNRRAEEHKRKNNFAQVELHPVNILQNDIPSDSADFVVSCFGIKTFNTQQLQQFAKEVQRILKPNGVFAFVEISEPKGWILHALYMFYIKWIIPLIGALFLGNAEDYRMLGQYCEDFKDSSAFGSMLSEVGLETQFHHYFYGCATGVSGKKL